MPVSSFAMSSSLNSKSNTSAFSLIRAGVTDFGRGTKPYTVSQPELEYTAQLKRGRGNKYLLQTPPNEDLRRSLPILFPQLLQHRLIGLCVPDKRRVGLHHSPPLLQPIHNIRSRQPRMQLILPDIDLPAAARRNIILELVEVVHPVIRNTDRARFARFLGFDEGFPGAESAFFAAVGGVD